MRQILAKRREEERLLDEMDQSNQGIADEITTRCRAIVETIESVDGIVLTPIEDGEDSLVIHVEEAKTVRVQRLA